MNIARNMEAIFVFVLGTLVAQGVATAAINAKPVNASVATYTVNDAGIAVVTVTAKRLHPVQKAAAS
ncbi:MAG TPA: hypothetical protein VGE60_09525 [Telluria sp.]